MSISELPQAVLLVGPTGSGKSPLGDCLAEHGLWDRTCHHFDFGRNLRTVAMGDRPGFERHEALFLQNVLNEGTLLEDSMFYLAEKVWRAFRAEAGLDDGDIVLMNGLPRHIGQAEDADKLVSIIAVIHLQCDATTAVKRLEANAGGDREGREDDLDPKLVQDKLKAYEQRTKPLVVHYANKGVPVIEVKITADSQPADLLPGLGKAPETLREVVEA